MARRRKIPKPENLSIVFLPEEIITEHILPSVPVKPLLRFRCVSRSWLTLISSPRFVNSHLTIISNSPRILSAYRNPFHVEHFSLRTLKPPTGLALPWRIPENGSFSVLGSCNGLVCVAIDFNNLFIWNPCTRVYKGLPTFNVVGMTRYDYYVMYGFGYRKSNDDYKVVAVAFPHKGNFGNQILVYSSRMDFWKVVGDFKDGRPMYDYGCFFIGKIHFHVTLHDHARRDGIVSVDLENDVFGIIKGPVWDGSVRVSSLDVLKGSLCILHSTKICAHLWVMKEYGVEGTWRKMFSIPYFKLHYRENRWYCTPLVVLPSGEILLVPDNRHFVAYNPKNKHWWVLESRRVLENWNFSRSMVACVYVESLVSPIANE